MAVSQTAQLALAVSLFGLLAFIFGVVAENKKPPGGTLIPGKDVTICKYPSDPTVALGSLSVVTLFISAVLGLASVYFPYKGKSVPSKVLFQSTSLCLFLFVAVTVTLFAEAMMLWATITEASHRVHNVHRGVIAECSTAKTGLFGGAAFLALDAALFWLVCQMLTLNVRADYLEDEDPKGTYGQVLAVDHETNSNPRV